MNRLLLLLVLVLLLAGCGREPEYGTVTIGPITYPVEREDMITVDDCWTIEPTVTISEGTKIDTERGRYVVTNGAIQERSQ